LFAKSKFLSETLTIRRLGNDHALAELEKANSEKLGGHEGLNIIAVIGNKIAFPTNVYCIFADNGIYNQ